VTEVVCIGTSDAFGAGGRRQSAYLVRAESSSLLLDCGVTTVTGLAFLGIDRNEIDAIVVSHFHGDHFGGIPAMLLAAVYGDLRRRPLDVAGPPGIEERVRNVAWALGHPIEGRELGFDLRFRELSTGQRTAIAGFEIETFATHHAPEACPHGVLCRANGRSIAYSGDTGWFDTLPDKVRGADLFLCECTQEGRGYPYHLSLEELEPRRGELDCGRILLTHLGREMRERSDYRGFEVADDGLVVKV
jgi:ribonuclease BN (tRNA processing enzyme)